MRKALIVIDMLNDFIHPQGKLYCGPTVEVIVPIIQDKLKTARAAGNVVIFLCDGHMENDKEFEKFPPHAITGSTGARITSALAVEDNDILVRKTRYSGFYGTGLEDLLRAEKVEEVEVVGVCTSICVMDTVGGLANRDIPVTVNVNAVADFDQNNHKNALERMKALYGANIIGE